MSITDALSRISQIQQQLAELSGGSVTGASASQATTGAATSTSATDGTSAASGTSFADALSQAQGGTDATATTDATAATDATSGGTAAGLTATTSPTVQSDAEFGAATSAANDSVLPLATTTELSSGGVSAGAATASGSALPAGASSMLNASQQQFASTLAADTGLNPGVISAWMLAEESGGAAQSRQAQSNNDWLNVGYTDGGNYGTSDSVWSDPVTAATATAGWLKGLDTIPGYGTAGAGVQAILNSVGQTPQAQIAALQSSGWASSGYPNLASLYDEVTA